MQLLSEEIYKHIDELSYREKISADRLEQIDEQLSKLSDTDVRIQKLPKMRVVLYKPENMWFDISPVQNWLSEKRVE